MPPTRPRPSIADRLTNFHASNFGIIVGLAGLANAWRAATRAWGVPEAPGEATFVIAAAAFLVAATLFALKWALATAAARAEADHPIQCCFIGLGGVSAMQLAQGALPYNRTVAIVLFALGSTYAFAFGIWRTGLLWRGDRPPATTTPALHLPTVATGFVAGATAAALGWPDLARLAFGAAFFSWLAIESVVLHRLLTVEELPPPLRPLLGIQIAPAAVGAASYLAINGGHPDILMEAMVGYAMLQGLVVAGMARWIGEQPFTPGYWSFTFGGTTLAGLFVRLSAARGSELFFWLGLVAFVVMNASIALLGVRTIRYWIAPAVPAPHGSMTDIGAIVRGQATR